MQQLNKADALKFFIDNLTTETEAEISIDLKQDGIIEIDEGNSYATAYLILKGEYSGIYYAKPGDGAEEAPEYLMKSELEAIGLIKLIDDPDYYDPDDYIDTEALCKEAQKALESKAEEALDQMIEEKAENIADGIIEELKADGVTGIFQYSPRGFSNKYNTMLMKSTADEITAENFNYCDECYPNTRTYSRTLDEYWEEIRKYYIDEQNADFYNINRNEYREGPRPNGYLSELFSLTIDITDKIKIRDREKREKAEAQAQKEYEEKISNDAFRASNGQNSYSGNIEKVKEQQKDGNSRIISGAEQGFSI